MTLLLRVFVSPRLEEQAREHAQRADTGHQHHMAGEADELARAADVGVGVVGRRAQLPRRLADALQGDHAGFLLAGFVAQLGDDFFNGLFLRDAPAACSTRSRT